MLIPYSELLRKYNLKVNGILHIGAHKCEELGAYTNGSLSKDKIIWLEGNPTLVKNMKAKDSEVRIYHCLVSDKDGDEVTFNITNNGESSSILELGTHKQLYPFIKCVEKIQLKTSRVDSLFQREGLDKTMPNFLNIDIQGAELMALKGMGKMLENFDYVYLEVNNDYVYKDCCLIGEIDEYLRKYNFVRMETKWWSATPQHPFGAQWGDAFYIKTWQF